MARAQLTLLVPEFEPSSAFAHVAPCCGTTPILVNISGHVYFECPECNHRGESTPERPGAAMTAAHIFTPRRIH